MTIEEIREKLIELGYTDWANDRIVTVKYPLVGFSAEFKGLTTVFEFLTQQVEGFNKYENPPREIKNIAADFNRLKLEIETMVKSQNLSDHNWNNTIKNTINRDNPPKLLYDSPETKFLMYLHANSPNYFQSAYQYLTQPSLNNINDTVWFTGYVLAYEFKKKNSSDITKRREAEKKALEDVRNDFLKYLTEGEQHLMSYLQKGKNEVETQSNNLTALVKTKKDEFDGWYDKTKEEFRLFDQASKKQMADWETLYLNKLMLEAPAQYWRKRAKKLKRESWVFLSGLIVSVGTTVLILFSTLNSFADGSLEKIFAATGTAIKWSIILVTTISFLAFIIRTLAKLCYSSFHLSRDAEEREQLTYVYLALKQQKGVDETERHLIMQSLFSRADTGLLKDEGGPTMPGNIIDQAMKNK